MAASQQLVRSAPAAAELRGSVLGYRGFHFGARGPRRRLVVPDGVVKVMLGFGAPLDMVDAVGPRTVTTGTSLVNGLRTTAAIGLHRGLLHGVTVLLSPPAAYRLFAVPMSEWAHLTLDPGELLGHGLGQLTERLAECPDWPARFALLDHALAARLRTGPRCDPEVAWAWSELLRTDGRLRIADLAAGTGWSRRHLERRFREQLGPTPKGAAQVLRLQAALRLKQAGMSWTRAATGAGFHDQAHFSHTFGTMTGCTPGRFHDARSSGGGPDDSLDFLPEHVTSVLLAR
ncbi:helix-turn-helix domain-containing protein [Streptomyces sp. NPDC001407]|uniref:helix-turn-helix domain-containing protein n=1 Tax=Streptomyces sp. NPDC001407 TaxID=3364573 RepID=UPI0036901781